MKIKIEKIIDVYEPKELVRKKDGGKYFLFSWKIGYFFNGKKEAKILKSFSKKSLDIIKEGVEIEVKEEPNSYTKEFEFFLILEQQEKTFHGKNEVKKIDWNTYKSYVKNIWALSQELSKEKSEMLFDKILGCATIVLDFSADGIQTVFDGEIVKGAIINDEEIPF